MKQDAYQQQYEDVSSPIRIAAILRPLQQQHIILSVALPGAKRLYNSTLLEIDPEQGFLLLDELNPGDGHALISQASRIGLTAHREGIEIKMLLDLNEVGSDKGIAFYKTDFPKTIRYRQRRNSFRITISAAQRIPVELSDEQDRTFSGELQDISAEGMCLRLPLKTAIPETDSSVPLNYTITLPGRKMISGQFVARHAVIHEASRCHHIGGHFEQPDRAQARAIERFVIELQREERRKAARQ